MIASQPMTLEDEILNAMPYLDPRGVSGYQIATWIEDHSPPQPWRFLWWHGETERLIPFGTMYRALDRLTKRGALTRTRYMDNDRPRERYTLPGDGHAID